MLIIDLEQQTVHDKSRLLIKNGKPVNGFTIDDTCITFDYLEELYATYKRSVPDTIKYKHKYFKALTSQQMTLKDLVTGANRQKAKEQLEMAILTGVINGSLKWPDDSKWFWQSEKDKDFVLLKKWIVHQT